MPSYDKKDDLQWSSSRGIPINWALIGFLVDRTSKINNISLDFHKDICKFIKIHKKNIFPTHLIEGTVNRHVTNTQSDPDCSPGLVSTTAPMCYFKLPYICSFSSITQKTIRHLLKRYYNDLDIKLVFSSFKIGNMFGVKNLIPSGLHLCVMYKFLCAYCYSDLLT